MSETVFVLFEKSFAALLLSPRYKAYVNATKNYILFQAVYIFHQLYFRIEKLELLVFHFVYMIIEMIGPPWFIELIIIFQTSVIQGLSNFLKNNNKDLQAFYIKLWMCEILFSIRKLPVEHEKYRISYFHNWNFENRFGRSWTIRNGTSSEHSQDLSTHAQ